MSVSVSRSERLKLMNQYRILSHLEPELSNTYGFIAKHLQEACFQRFSGDCNSNEERSEEIYQLVRDVIEVYQTHYRTAEHETASDNCVSTLRRISGELLGQVRMDQALHLQSQLKAG